VIKAVILDFDDTLFMTEQASFEIENETAGLLGLAPMTRETHVHNWGKPIEHAIIERFPGIDLTKFMEAFPAVLRSHVRAGRIDALTDANTVALAQITASGYRLYAVTSRKLVEIDHLLSSEHEFSRYVEEGSIFHKDNSQHLKPDPRAFDGVIALTGFKPAECVYVGDSLTDCRAAKGAGLQFVACLESGLRHREEFEALGSQPDGFVDTFAGITDWLSRRR
jgi:phosphoglycolate phosphatase